MPIVKTKPTSAGRRHVVKLYNPDLHKGRPYEPLVETQLDISLANVITFAEPADSALDLTLAVQNLNTLYLDVEQLQGPVGAARIRKSVSGSRAWSGRVPCRA